MASTSGSEDFESADEDFIEDSKPTVGVSPSSLKSICQEQNDTQFTKSTRTILEVEQPTSESPCSSDLPENTHKNQGVLQCTSKHVHSIAEDPPIERRRKQQKAREPKGSLTSKKLGTRIGAPTKVVKSTTQSESVNAQVTISAPDPYAKFRGYAVPPTTPPVCWEHDQDGKVIVDHRHPTMGNAAKESEPQKNVTSEVKEQLTDPAIVLDPYAKFRGYAIPPTTPPVCWEHDKDGKVIVDHRHPTMGGASKQPELETQDNVPSEVKEQLTDPAIVLDPYAKFRGYAIPPTTPPVCWEHDKDGKVIVDHRHPTMGGASKEPDLETQDNAPSEVKEETYLASTVPDPDAKCRGDAIPPTTPPVCWEHDADSNVIVDHRHLEMGGASKESKRKENVASGMKDNQTATATFDTDPIANQSGQQEKTLEGGGGWEDDIDDDILDSPDTAASKNDVKACDKEANTASENPDPYAKFRGYSKPPLIEQCWEPGVDYDIVQDEIDAKYLASKASGKGENLGSVFDKLSQTTTQQDAGSSWGGWGNWGVSSLLSSATEGVSSLTSHVSSVLESSIGAPNPEELARIDKLEEKKIISELKSSEPEQEAAATQGQSGGMFGFGQLMTSVSSISKLVETTGSKVIHGGLDTLETIGKKTMEVLQEGDPGLKKKRAMFTDKTVLSQVLREAKIKAELEDKEFEDKQAIRNIHFETLFDDFQGLVHLEALEMLSKQCDMKIHSLLLAASGPALSALQNKLQEIKDLCQLPDDDDDDDAMDEEGDDQAGKWLQKLKLAEDQLGIPIATGKLESVWKEITDWLQENQSTAEVLESKTEEQPIQKIHQKAVSTLARLTALSVEQFHKGAELLLVKEKRNAFEEAKALLTITTVLCSQVSTAATHFCEHLNGFKENSKTDTINSSITNIFLEASNSSSYIQEAFQLLIPVLQAGVP